MISYIFVKVQRMLFLSHFGQIQIMSHFRNQYAIKLLRDHQIELREKILLSSAFGLQFQKNQKQKVKKRLLQKAMKKQNQNLK